MSLSRRGAALAANLVGEITSQKVGISYYLRIPSYVFELSSLTKLQLHAVHCLAAHSNGMVPST